MTDQPLTAIPRPTQVPAIPARLEPDAIGVAQDTIIGLASSAPAATMAVTMAGMAATAAYGGGPVIILCGIPMLILANTYRRLNLWNANCGASFEWVGRAINPYLGFIVGWMMLAGCLTGTISVVVVLSPAVLAVFGASSVATWPNILLSTAVIVVMATIAVIGIRLTARTQVGMAVIEYAILIGFSVWALLHVLGHHPGTFPITKGWLSLSGINGKGNLAAGLLIAVFMYTGWDATVYVNEEVKHRRVNPGRAAVFAVALLVDLVRPPAGRHAGRGVAGHAAGELLLGAGLRRPSPGRRRVGQGDGLRAGPVGDRVHQHRYRDHLPDRLRDGESPGAAAGPGQREPPLLHPRDRHHHHRRRSSSRPPGRTCCPSRSRTCSPTW